MTYLIIAIIAVIIATILYQVVKLRRVVGQNREQLAPSTHPDLLVELSFDNDFVTAKYPDGGIVKARWQDITTVGLASIEATPGSPSLYWGIHTGKRIPTISYPHGAVGDKELLAELSRRLPNFDMEKVMLAVTSSERTHFQIWPKK